MIKTAREAAEISNAVLDVTHKASIDMIIADTLTKIEVAAHKGETQIDIGVKILSEDYITTQLIKHFTTVGFTVIPSVGVRIGSKFFRREHIPCRRTNGITANRRDFVDDYWSSDSCSMWNTHESTDQQPVCKRFVYRWTAGRCGCSSWINLYSGNSGRNV